MLGRPCLDDACGCLDDACVAPASGPHPSASVGPAQLVIDAPPVRVHGACTEGKLERMEGKLERMEGRPPIRGLGEAARG